MLHTAVTGRTGWGPSPHTKLPVVCRWAPGTVLSLTCLRASRKPPELRAAGQVTILPHQGFCSTPIRSHEKSRVSKVGRSRGYALTTYVQEPSVHPASIHLCSVSMSLFVFCCVCSCVLLFFKISHRSEIIQCLSLTYFTQQCPPGPPLWGRWQDFILFCG